jgi:hypothetical protein
MRLRWRHAFFEGLTRHFENVSGKLRKFIHGGRMDGIRLANIVFPDPGGTIINMLRILSAKIHSLD